VLLVSAGAGVRARDRAAAVMTSTASALVAGDSIHVDGLASERSWSSAMPITAFQVREPNEGALSEHPTTARVLYDDSALYVAIDAAEPHEGLVKGILTRRDESSPSDWLSVIVDSFTIAARRSSSASARPA
jgi:hypothetical protein